MVIKDNTAKRNSFISGIILHNELVEIPFRVPTIILLVVDFL